MFMHAFSSSTKEYRRHRNYNYCFLMCTLASTVLGVYWIGRVLALDVGGLADVSGLLVEAHRQN